MTDLGLNIYIPIKTATRPKGRVVDKKYLVTYQMSDCTIFFTSSPIRLASAIVWASL